MMTTDDLTAAVVRLREYTDTYDTYCPKPELRLVLSALEAAQAERDALRECVKAADNLRYNYLMGYGKLYDAARAKVKP